MADKNFTMKEKTATGYDNLYPKTKAEQVLKSDGKTVADALAKVEDFMKSAGNLNESASIANEAKSKANDAYTLAETANKTAGEALSAAASPASAQKLTTPRTIDGVNFDGSANIIHYGTCSTAAATAAKTVALTGFVLETGSRVAVKFTNANTHASPTLNVNSTGAKDIYYGTSYATSGMLGAGIIHLFEYDGTQWQLINPVAGVNSVVVGTFTGNADSATVTSQTINLGFTPKAVFITNEIGLSYANIGMTTNIAQYFGGLALNGSDVTMTVTDSDNVTYTGGISIVTNGFTVSGIYKEIMLSGGSSRYHLYYNNKNRKYMYIAFK